MDEETVDYPMGIRQSATIAFPDVSSRLTEKRCGRKQRQLTDEDDDDDDDDTSDEREVDDTSERADVAGSCDDKDTSNEKEIDTMLVDEKQESFDDLPPHLKIGQEFTLRVTVLQAYGIASEYSDIFTQFK